MKMPRLVREKAEIYISLRVPENIRGAIRSVLQGEYETPYNGKGLNILDIGANVGAFTLWANIRWPQSTIYSYEAHPETFAILKENTRHLDNVICNNVTVYPSVKSSEAFWSRYVGDVEAGLAANAGKMFKKLEPGNIIEVPVLHPRDLPAADIIKIDVEGGEALILGATALHDVSLILLEYHDLENRNALESLLKDDFILDYEEGSSWDSLLQDHAEYNPALAGNRTGVMFFSNIRRNRLQRS